MTMKHLLLIALLCGCTQRNDETNSRAQSATIPNARQETMLQADASEGAGKTPGFAWQAAAWQEHSRNHAFAIATLFGAAIALILVNTMLTLTMSYTTMLAYLSGALFYLLFMMDLTGVVPLLPSPWEAIFARALPVWGALMVTCMVWFSVRFLGITREIYPRTIALCNL